MSCIITYKGQKYSEEQFKEYFINNKNEFVTSIAKNKDVVDSFKRKMEGIDFVFSQSPELASIGSKAQYLQYLSTIFKTSKVKDIVYHTTPNRFDKFDKNFIGKGIGNTTEGVGFYFSNRENSYEEYKSIVNVKNIEQSDNDILYKQYKDLEEAKQKLNNYLITKLNTQLNLDNIEYINEGNLPLEVYNNYDTFKKLNDNYFNLKNEIQSSAENRSMNEDGVSYEEDVLSRAEGLEANFLRIILNIQNPKIFNTRQSLKNNESLKNNDGTITNIGEKDVQYVVFEPEQIHILGSKQDIEGFEKYIFNKSKQSPVEVLDNTEEIAEADNSPVSITPKKEVIQLPKTAQLILPIGISGSGKSTWISSLDKNKYTIISPDEIRKELTGDVSDNSRNIEIFKIVDDRILEALKKGDKVILDATNLNTTFRRLMITNLKSLYPILDIRYKLLDVDPEIAKQRIANDISNKVDRSKTPDEIIDLQYQQYLQSKLDIKDEPIYEFNNERTAITDLLDRYSKNDNSLRKLTNIAAISGKTQNISNVPIVKDTDNINENIITMAKYGRTVRELLAIYPSLTEHFKGINLDTKLSDYIKQQEIEKQVTDYVEAIKQDMADNFSDYEDYLSKIDVYTIDDLYNYPNEKLLNDLCINGNLSK